jgi:hypothetical protein
MPPLQAICLTLMVEPPAAISPSRARGAPWAGDTRRRCVLRRARCLGLRVHPPLPHLCLAEGFPSYPPLRALCQHLSCCEHRGRSRAAGHNANRHHQDRHLMTTISALRRPSADLACCWPLTGRDDAQQIGPFPRRGRLPTAASNLHLDHQPQLLLPVGRVIHRCEAHRTRPRTPSRSAKSP